MLKKHSTTVLKINWQKRHSNNCLYKMRILSRNTSVMSLLLEDFVDLFESMNKYQNYT